MMRFRWGVLASLTAVVVLLSGCEGFKFVRLSEYNRLKELNKQQGDVVRGLLDEKEDLTNENAALKSMLGQSETYTTMLQEEKKRLEEALKAAGSGTGPTYEGAPGLETVTKYDGVGVVAASDLLFDTGSATLKTQGKAALDQVVSYLKGSPNKIRVAGYTDSQWTGVSTKFQSNFHLSAMRALSVLNYLKEKGVDPARMHLAGYGEHELILEGGKENKNKSRRVEIILLHDWATRVSGEPAPELVPK